MSWETEAWKCKVHKCASDHYWKSWKSHGISYEGHSGSPVYVWYEFIFVPSQTECHVDSLSRSACVSFPICTSWNFPIPGSSFHSAEPCYSVIFSLHCCSPVTLLVLCWGANNDCLHHAPGTWTSVATMIPLWLCEGPSVSQYHSATGATSLRTDLIAAAGQGFLWRDKANVGKHLLLFTFLNTSLSLGLGEFKTRAVESHASSASGTTWNSAADNEVFLEQILSPVSCFSSCEQSCGRESTSYLHLEILCIRT